MSGPPLGKLLVTRQEFPVGFYPTDVIALSSNQLLVAGKRRGTETVIQRWTFRWPQQMPTPGPPNGGGPIQVETAHPTLTGVSEIYVGDIAGKRVVSKMVALLGTINKALVQFDDSNDLYLLDVGEGTLSIVASPNGGTPLGLVPGLADKHPFIWAAEHLTHGYIYVCGTHWGLDPTVPRADVLIFIDANKDGIIETTTTVPVAAWDASIYGDHQNYVD